MGAPEELAARLASPDEEIRHAAVQSLRGAGPGELPRLVAALGDPSWRVRKAALELLLEFPPALSIPPLVEGLRDEGNAGLRNSAMETLVRLGRATVPALAPLVGDRDADLRKFVVDTLGGIEAAEATTLLRVALDDVDENVAAAAAEHLGRRRDEAAAPALRRRLAERRGWLSFACLRALGEIGDAAAAPAIVALLGEPGLRPAALEALGRLGGAEAVIPLLDALFSGQRALRAVALSAAHRLLGRLGSGAAASTFAAGVRARADAAFFAFLHESLRHHDSQVRTAAISLLGCAPGKPAAAMAIEVLADAPEAEQAALADILAALPEGELQPLVPALGAPSPAVRLRLAEVFGRREHAGAVPALLGLLSDRTGHVRAAAATALGRIGDPVAAAPLVALLRDPFPDVREAGMAAIVAMGGRNPALRELILALIAPHFAAAEEELAAAAVRIAGRLGDHTQIGRIALALRDDRGGVRRAAVEALGALGGSEAVEALRAALTDEDVAVRREAVARLGGTREPEALELLLPMLGDEDLWVRVRAVQALAGFADSSARGILLSLAATDPPGPRRLAAIRALGAGKVSEGLPILTGLAGSPDPETGRAAIEALGALGDAEALGVLLFHLADPAWGLRAVAVRALGPFAADARVRAALATAADADPDPLVRSLAAGLLAPAGGRAAGPGT
ncbi:MAG TPA: HEAT repeat domain-containing protein [Candidatus Methanoperedens sp.]|nr:HEAT repeat domain-containing protein [Candidatus Methanoperedens sp.]